MRRPTPPARSERDQIPVQMDADTASHSSEKDTRAVPEDPDARKVFIQQVSGVHSIHHSWWHVLTIPAESNAPPQSTPNRHAQRHRPPD